MIGILVFVTVKYENNGVNAPRIKVSWNFYDVSTTWRNSQHD